MQRVFSLLVDNNPGVLSRVSGLFSRRGYSIDSITAGVTADPRFTRITIVASGSYRKSKSRSESWKMSLRSKYFIRKIRYIAN